MLLRCRSVRADARRAQRGLQASWRQVQCGQQSLQLVLHQFLPRVLKLPELVQHDELQQRHARPVHLHGNLCIFDALHHDEFDVFEVALARCQ